MAIPSPVGDVKIVFPISTFVLNTLTLKYSAFCDNMIICDDDLSYYY